MACKKDDDVTVDKDCFALSLYNALSWMKLTNVSCELTPQTVYSAILSNYVPPESCQEALRVANREAGVKQGASISESELQSMRQRRNRAQYSMWQVQQLEKSFNKNPYPDLTRREILADKLDMIEARVQVWFQNRRAKERRKFKFRGKLSTEKSSDHMDIT